MTVTVLLPLPPQGPAGQRNFERVLRELEQAEPDHIELLPDATPESVWRSVEDSQSDWIWIHHPHLLLPFSEVMEGIRSCSYPALKPYQSYVQLNREESESLTSVSSPKKALGTSLGKASLVIKRELFLALGGLHPTLGLDGDEGFELARRIRHFFGQVPSLDLKGQYLFRAISPQEREERKENRIRRDALRTQFESDPQSYLQGLSHFQSKAIQKMVKEQALAFTNPRPPRRKPKKLGGKFWALSTFFNPEQYQTKLENFRSFREKLELPLCVVELAFGNLPFELNDSDAELLIQIRGGDVLWQKERLLNLGLENLPPDCDKVAWLDADVLFEREDWAQATAELLQDYQVVQPFSLSVRLQPGEKTVQTQDLPLGSAEHQVLHSIAYGVAAKGTDCLKSYLNHGHTGYAWAARRELLANHGFYQANILGNADLNIAQAMFGGRRFLKTDRLSTLALEHLETWADAFFESVEGSVAHLLGTLFHLWHGNKQDRLYHGRLEVLKEHDFDPESDLRVGDNGALCWSSAKPELHAWCEQYFALRAEDPQ